MNPFLLGAKDRLGDWKDFRKSLITMNEQKQIAAVVNYWSKAPLIKHAYDLDNPDTIPTPWEMISLGDWCVDSVAIGMEFTLRLAGWDSSRLKLVMVRDYDISEMKVILIIDEMYWLNYSYGMVCNTPTSRYDIIGQWRFSGKHYEPILTPVVNSRK